ncbi:hypothetical protein P9294_gp023 [Bacillus phage FADO]|uniref:Uncharacterized protein n=1 Tax=Bacillus phage FADO TaxID=2917160 RepID=A0AAE9GBM3_9CAUD|nr:hypothetical protein P9294_gp023 [Bacillus phage FADO]UNY48738.1 hypothetical protein fado_23 [Bacillus phage FADO]
MRVEISILYNSGVEEKILQECSQKEIEEVINIVKSTFKEGLNAVIQLGNEEGLRLVSLRQVARINFKEIESE